MYKTSKQSDSWETEWHACSFFHFDKSTLSQTYISNRIAVWRDFKFILFHYYFFLTISKINTPFRRIHLFNLIITVFVSRNLKSVSFPRLDPSQVVQNFVGSVLTFHLLHGGQFSFPEIVERMGSGRLEVPRVLSEAAAGRVTTRAHARMISQSPFVQIRMRQCIHHGDPLVLRQVREPGQRTIDMNET